MDLDSVILPKKNIMLISFNEHQSSTINRGNWIIFSRTTKTITIGFQLPSTLNQFKKRMKN